MIMKFTKSYEPGEFEPRIYAEWEKTGVFQPRKLQMEADERDETETGECYSLVMPPPNANGNLHIGHGLTVAIEDSLARYYRLRGKSTWYIPGADHAGFETWVVYERALEKEGHTRFEYSRDELYARVWKFVEEQRGNMELQVRALGASCAWGDLTFTLDENVVSRVYKTFEKMWNDGMIYRGEKLVNYCPQHQTAFADIEVDYREEKTPLYYIKYGPFTLATTRPETKFGDTAVAVNPGDERYKEWVGKTITVEGVNGPFEVEVIADEMVDMEFGTGVVKITPAHDFNDWEVGQRHNLRVVQVIGEDGRMTEVAGRFAGMPVKEAREAVVKAMDEMGMIVKIDNDYVTKVPHCYKCGAVIEPMLKQQWFIDVERLAKGAIERLEAGEIKFYPANKKKVLINYLKNLKDWNISRQIPWGIAIPMFHQTETENAPEWVFDVRTNLEKIEVGGVKYYRDEDTFDTWFSSSHWPIVCTNWIEAGLSSGRISSSEPASAPSQDDESSSVRSSVLPRTSSQLTSPVTASNGRANPYYPLNVMETAGDILFAWVARMIMMGVYVTGEVPFREVYLHGLVLDAHGQKMSKSKGNVINPMELVTKYGSDAFRLGILRGRSAGMNQAFSENSVMAGRNLCNKLWNLARFIQGMVDESHSGSIEAAEMALAEAEAEVVNAGAVRAGREMPYATENMGEDWICRELTACKEEIEDDMEAYRFSEAVEKLHSVIWDKYADWFIESQKIYKNLPLFKVTLEMILKMLHPFAPFVTEAIWQSLSWTGGMLIAQQWPSRLKFDPISASNFESLMGVVSEIRRVSNELLGASKGKKWTVLYGDDALVDDNQLLVAKLAGVESVISCEGQPRGLRLALANHEVYLDVPTEVVTQYRDKLEEKILKVGQELDALNKRMMNPNYVDKAPVELVKQTREGIEEKMKLIQRLKGELRVIE